MRRCWKMKYLQMGRASPPDLGSGALFMCIGAMCGREDDGPAPAAAVVPKAGAVLLSIMIVNTSHQPPATKPHIIARCAVPAVVQTAVRLASGTSFYSLSARRSPAFLPHDRRPAPVLAGPVRLWLPLCRSRHRSRRCPSAWCLAASPRKSA